MATTASFTGDPQGVTDARHWITDQLGGRDAPGAEVAELLSSELATNTIKHTASGRPDGSFTVQVDIATELELVWVGVTDQGSAITPAAGPRECTLSLGGRGLSIVEALARSWGYELVAGGLLVWILIDAASEPRPRSE